MVSERLHAGEQKNAYRVFQCAMRFAIAVGAAMSIVTFLFAGVITKYAMKAENASYALLESWHRDFPFCHYRCVPWIFPGTEHHGSHGGLTGHRAGGKCHCLWQQPFFLWGMEQSSVKEKGNDSLGPAYGAAGGTLGTVVSIAVALLFLFVVYMAYRGG